MSLCSVWRHIPAMSALGRLRQEALKLEISVGYTVRQKLAWDAVEAVSEDEKTKAQTSVVSRRQGWDGGS